MQNFLEEVRRLVLRVKHASLVVVLADVFRDAARAAIYIAAILATPADVLLKQSPALADFVVIIMTPLAPRAP